ncbi:MAG TPA: hypothetical protein PKA82_10985 [Pyrinomonadaceae bacterium]|nr:hypothetical protein [Pyrinomonadaceae bacterium]
MYRFSKVQKIVSAVACCIVLLIVCSTGWAQTSGSGGKAIDLTRSIAWLRADTEKRLPYWKEIFSALGMESSYDPDAIAGFCLRGGSSAMECQIGAISGLIAFQKIHGDKVLDEALPKLQSLLLDFQNCESDGSCTELEDELKELTDQVEAPPTNVGSYDPEKVYSECLAEQDPKNPCTKQFCINTALNGGSFVLLLTMNNTDPSKPLTPQQKQNEQRKERLVAAMNRLAKIAQATALDKRCDMSKFVPSVEKPATPF